MTIEHSPTLKQKVIYEEHKSETESTESVNQHLQINSDVKHN